MPTPQLGLSALSILTPSIPETLTTLSVDTSVLELVIEADTNTVAIDVSLAGTTTTLTTYTSVNGKFHFTGSIPVSNLSGPQTIEITGRNWNATVNPATSLVTPTIQFDVLFTQSNLAVMIGPPTGVTIYRGQNSCRVEWALPTYAGFQGVRVQWSTDPSGVNTPYLQYGNLVTEVARSADVALGSPKTTTATTPVGDGTNDNNVITTTKQITSTVNYSSVDIPASVVNADQFFVIITTLVEDADTNLVYESQAAGPFTCGFVDLKKVNPTDFLALQKATDIASRMITEITRRRPDLDLTAHSEIRDLIINPFSIEIANMSVREWFSRASQSISALAQIDDADGDGVSDPYDTSTLKQQIARAYGLSATDVQTFIDQRFVVLGELAGVPKGGATTSVVMATFYTYSLPTQQISLPEGMVVSTRPTSTTAAVTFVTRASAVIDPASASAYYDPVNAWWGVSVPAEAQTAGSTGSVGAGTITQVLSGGPTGISVTNLNASTPASDTQSNADYAAMIQNRLVAGKDTGSRGGYWNAAMQIPGITDALVIAAGDVDMLRDWSAVMNKHTFGSVDVYTRGGTISQQTESLPLTLPTASTYGSYSTYLAANFLSLSNLSFRIQNFSSLTAPVYAAVEMVAVSAGHTVWLGVQNAQFDNTNGVVFLDPNEQTYIVNGDGTTTPWQINGVNATNLQFLQAVNSSPVTFSLMAQLQSGITHTPALQPVTSINSITGPLTGNIPSSSISLVYTSDFLLNGGSNKAGDLVSVPGTSSVLTTKTLTIATATTTIDDNMQISVDANGVPQNVISVRSADLSTVYVFGTDYTIVPAGKYRTYAIKLKGNAITPGANTKLVVAYYRYQLRETVTLQTDTLTLTGSTPSPLSKLGFIKNTWLPESHGQTALLLDGYAASNLAYTGLMGAGVAPTSRYIKVTYNNGAQDVIMIEGRDFTLDVDASTGAATLTRTIGGSIPSGAAITVKYYTLEVLSVATEYPAFVQQLVNAIAASKHAGADVLIKAMVPTAIDLTMNVVLNSATTPDTIDGRIRTTVALVMNNADNRLYQDAITSAVRALPGMKSVQLPLLKCAKADGSYNIGQVLPTGTTWLPLSLDAMFKTVLPPANTFISEDVLLTDPTIPSGGPSNAYVGLLYEGQSYRRALTINDFLTGPQPSFYIIGTNDEINTQLPLTSAYSGKVLLSTPTAAPDPSLRPYRLTYQVFGAASANDIKVASSEFLTVGSVQINYVTES